VEGTALSAGGEAAGCHVLLATQQLVLMPQIIAQKCHLLH
jgi:hypothetical protein